jgi:uncharacterized delta-60 repeat protein
MKAIINLLFTSWLFCPIFGFSQIFDESFKPNINSAGIITTMKIQPNDGKMIVVGRFLNINGLPANNIARFNPDGSLDTEFMAKVGNGANASIKSLEIQKNGGILLGGDFAFFNNVLVNRFVRLKPDGTIDLEFSNKIGSAANFAVNVIIEQANLDILIAGRFTTFNDLPTNLIVRLKPDGSLDNDFLAKSTNGIRANQQIFSAILVDNKIIIGGSFTRFIKENVRRLTCLNFDGSMDEAFNAKLGAACNDNVFTLTHQPIGNMILVGGVFTRFNNRNANRTFRLFIDGSRDNSFAPPNAASIQTIAVTADNKIIIGGVIGSSSTQYAKQIAFLNSDGTLPADFNTNLGTGADDRINIIKIDKDNNIWIGGDYETFNGQTISLVKLKPDGLIDNTYPTIVLIRRMSIDSLIEQNNQILIAGEPGRVDGKPVTRIFRINQDGTLDESFVNNIGIGPNGFVNKLYLLQNGNILALGEFSLYNGQPANHLVCLLPDGTLNTEFMNNIGTATNGDGLTAIAQQVNGKILIGGNFSEFNGLPYNNIISLNPDGTIDQNFVIGSGFNDEIRTIQLLSDGGIIIGGEFTEYNGTIANRIIRLTSSGSINSNFITLGADNFIVQGIVQANDKIILGGVFGSFNGVEKFRLARINSGGALDNSFQFSLIPNTIDGINNFNLQSIGGEQKILMAGAFTSFSGASRFLVRLNENGTLDESFNLAGAINLESLVFAYVLKNNNIIIAGDFPTSIIRLLTPAPPNTPSNLQASTTFGNQIDLTWTSDNTNTFYQLQRSNNANSGFVTITTTEPGQKQYTDTEVDINKQYYYRVRAISVGNASVYSNVVGIIISPLITGDNSQDLTQKLKVYPNPSLKEVSLDFSEILPNFTQDLKIELYTQQGQLWQNIKPSADFAPIKIINLTNLPAGVYWLKISSSTHQIIKKIIKN